MEGPDVDWKMEEEEGKSDMKWILEKGFDIAKKVVITGFMISSAPLIVPPVAIVSMLGFACSIPLGVIFASYVCTKKIMNMLLPMPMPTSSPLMEHDTMLEYEAKGSGNEDQSPEEDIGLGEDERLGGGRDVKIEGEGDGEEKGPIQEGKKDNEPLPESSGASIEGDDVEAEKGPIIEGRKDDEPLPESDGQKSGGVGGEGEKGSIKEGKVGEPSPELSGEEKQLESGKVSEDSVEKNKDEGNVGDSSKKKKKKKTKSGAKN